MSTAMPPSGAANRGAAAETKPAMGKKNALFMAMITGLATEAKRKQEMAKADADEREPRQEAVAEVVPLASQRDAPVADMPKVHVQPKPQSEMKQETTVKIEPQSKPTETPRVCQNTLISTTPPPPPAAARTTPNLRTPSPSTYHKLLSINKLNKEDTPTHQIHAKAYREKAYVGPTRKNLEGSSPTPTDLKKTEVKDEDAFFAELKHRAALQHNLSPPPPTSSNAKDFQNDGISALGSKSFESVTAPSHVECKLPPRQINLPSSSTKVELPPKYLDVLPDDEKIDIVMDDRRNFKAPLPFDEKVMVEEVDVRSECVDAEVVGAGGSIVEEVQVIKVEAVQESSGSVIPESAQVEVAKMEEAQQSLEVEAVKMLVMTTDSQSVKAEAPVEDKAEAEEANVSKVEPELPAVEEAADLPVDPPGSFEEAVETKDTNVSTAANNNVNTSTTSVASHRSFRSAAIEDDIDEVRSIKSLPVSRTFKPTSRSVNLRRDFKDVLERCSVKPKELGAVTEDKVAEKVVVAEPKAVTQSTMAVAEVKEDVKSKKAQLKPDDDIDDEGTTSISIKEITISSTVSKGDRSTASSAIKGDRSTALASISSRIEHQTRRLEELEAEALRKHKEAETAAIDAREALEKMIEARGSAKGVEKESKIDAVKRGGMFEMGLTKTEPGKGLALEMKAKEKKEIAGEEYKSVSSRPKHTSDRVDQAEFDLCSTWSEDDLKSKTAPKPNVDNAGDFDYMSVSSKHGSLKGKDTMSTKSVSARSVTSTSKHSIQGGGEGLTKSYSARSVTSTINHPPSIKGDRSYVEKEGMSTKCFSARSVASASKHSVSSKTDVPTKDDDYMSTKSYSSRSVKKNVAPKLNEEVADSSVKSVSNEVEVGSTKSHPRQSKGDEVKSKYASVFDAASVSSKSVNDKSKQIPNQEVSLSEKSKDKEARSKLASVYDDEVQLSKKSQDDEEELSNRVFSRVQKDAKGAVARTFYYSEASASQYSRSFDESSCGTEEIGSYQEDESVPASETSTYASMERENRRNHYKQRDYEETSVSSRDSSIYDERVHEIRKKHEKKSHRSSNNRSSSRGRYQETMPPARKSRSTSRAKKEKSLMIPSLMSPDPPSNQERPFRRGGDPHAHIRSQSQPRSKGSHHAAARNDIYMSKVKTPNKPNHLLPYSSRGGSDAHSPRNGNFNYGISPETRQPVLTRQNSAPHEPSGRWGRPADAREPLRHHQPGISPETRQLSYDSQPIHARPNPRPFGGPTSYSRNLGTRTPDPVSNYARPYNPHPHYQRQQQKVGFYESERRDRMPQYSMPSGGELL